VRSRRCRTGTDLVLICALVAEDVDALPGGDAARILLWRGCTVQDYDAPGRAPRRVRQGYDARVGGGDGLAHLQVVKACRDLLAFLLDVDTGLFGNGEVAFDLTTGGVPGRNPVPAKLILREPESYFRWRENCLRSAGRFGAHRKRRLSKTWSRTGPSRAARAGYATGTMSIRIAIAVAAIVKKIAASNMCAFLIAASLYGL
jgi:hypothetical protein